jgi:hypothetical protein
LNIPIAEHLCTKDAFELLGPDRTDSEVQNIEYLFAGREVRKTITTEFDGWRLLYTSVEAGKVGGRRGELRLRPARTAEPDDPKLETEEAFLETAFKLADASYSSFEARNIIEKLVRTVPMYREKATDRVFKFFAKRPAVVLEPQLQHDPETGKRVVGV